MTASDLAQSAHVVIQCPACGASETAEPEALAGHPTIVCRECGETWPSARPRSKRRSELVSQTRAHVESNLMEASRRPLVTYSDGAESAWAAKVAGDHWPEPPRPRRLPMAVGAVAALSFLAAFFGAREAAVTALPDLAGLYAAIGLPVNLEGIAIEGVAADRTPTAAGDRIVVRGTIRNVAGKAMPVPQLAAILYDSAMGPSRVEDFDPPTATIAAGETASFTLTVDRAPLLATRVAVRFRQPDAKLPQGVEATPASATQ
ncbi:MAG: hypothetical protein ACRED5_01590 [Propylenella sp.]